MSQLYNLAKGNPGAIQFLISLMSGPLQDSVAGLTIIPFIEQHQITGDRLYVLWSDLAGKNAQLVAYLCKHCPKDVLLDACSRQDYSGRALVQRYVDEFMNNEIKLNVAHDL